MECLYYNFSQASEASGADLFIIPCLFFLLGLGIFFVLVWAYVCTFSPTRLRGPGITFLATFCFVYQPYEVAMPSETNSAKRDKTLETLGQEL